MQEGTVVEEGTHDSLFSDSNSAYHALVQLQQQAMDERAATRGDEVDAVDAAAADEVVVAAAVEPAAKGGSSKKVLDTATEKKKEEEEDDPNALVRLPPSVLACPSTAVDCCVPKVLFL